MFSFQCTCAEAATNAAEQEKGEEIEEEILFMTLKNFSRNNFAVASIVSLSSSTRSWAAAFPLFIIFQTCRHAWIWELPQKNYIGKSKSYNLRKLERVVHQQREAFEEEGEM